MTQTLTTREIRRLQYYGIAMPDISQPDSLYALLDHELALCALLVAGGDGAIELIAGMRIDADLVHLAGRIIELTAEPNVRLHVDGDNDAQDVVNFTLMACAFAHGYRPADIGIQIAAWVALQQLSGGWFNSHKLTFDTRNHNIRTFLRLEGFHRAAIRSEIRWCERHLPERKIRNLKRYGVSHNRTGARLLGATASIGFGLLAGGLLFGDD